MTTATLSPPMVSKKRRRREPERGSWDQVVVFSSRRFPRLTPKRVRLSHKRGNVFMVINMEVYTRVVADMQQDAAAKLGALLHS